MEPNCIIVRYGESFLKGKNRGLFEQKLVTNISALTGHKGIHRLQGRLIAPYFNNHQTLQRVFGLTSYSPAVKVEKRMESIQSFALQLLNNGRRTFRIETRRSDKTFPLASPEINKLVGIFIEAHSSLEFSFRAPDTTLFIEINQDGAYLFTETVPCFGGLPTGVGGKVHLLLEHQTDLLAGILMMKRGCTLIPVCVGKEMDTSLLQKFSPQNIKKSTSIPFGAVAVSGETFESRRKHPGLVFKPLIAYTQEQIDNEFRKYLQA